MVDVECDDGRVIGGSGRDARDTVVFLLIQGGDVERVFVELGVCHVQLCPSDCSCPTFSSSYTAVDLVC